MAQQPAAASRNAPSAAESRVPVYRSAAPSSMDADDAAKGDFAAEMGADPPLKALETSSGNVRAISSPHQDAILGLAQIGNAHGEPNSDRRQSRGEGERRDICEHAMAKIVRFGPVSLVARPVARLMASVLLQTLIAVVSPLAGRTSRRARPELEHTMLFFRRDGLLGFHYWQLRAFPCCLTRMQRALQKILRWHGCENLSLHGVVEPAVVDPDTAVFRGTEDICIALPKTDVGMIVGFSGVDRLRRNNIISGHHHDQRNA